MKDRRKVWLLRFRDKCRLQGKRRALGAISEGQTAEPRVRIAGP